MLATPQAGTLAQAGGPPAVDVAVLQGLVEDIGEAGVVIDTLDIYLEELPGRLDSMAVPSPASASKSCVTRRTP